MPDDLFEQLGIREPDIDLEVNLCTRAQPTAAVMVCYDRALQEQTSDLCMVAGDVTQTMAAPSSRANWVRPLRMWNAASAQVIGPCQRNQPSGDKFKHQLVLQHERYCREVHGYFLVLMVLMHLTMRWSMHASGARKVGE